MQERKGPSESKAFQRHADFYIGFLMDREKPVEELYLNLPQIALAKERVDEELVGTKFHPGTIDVRFREVCGGYVNIYLAKLVQGDASKEDLGHIETAIKIIQKGEAEYPINSGVLINMLDRLRISILKGPKCR